MTVDTNTIISITEAKQNFSKVTKLVDEHGTAVIPKNNMPRNHVIDFSVNAPKQGVVISSPMCVKLSENKFSGGTHERRKNNHMGRADPCLPE